MKSLFRRGRDRLAAGHEAADVAACGPNGDDGTHRLVPAPVSPVARRLALAYFVERCVDSGIIASYSEATAKLGITRARMSQILGLRLIPVEEPERLLSG